MPAPTPDQKMIEKVVFYKKKEIKNKAIARILQKDPKQIRRWVGYAKVQGLL